MLIRQPHIARWHVAGLIEYVKKEYYDQSPKTGERVARDTIEKLVASGKIKRVAP